MRVETSGMRDALTLRAVWCYYSLTYREAGHGGNGTHYRHHRLRRHRVRPMLLMLRQDEPGDHVIASRETVRLVAADKHRSSR